MRALFAAVVAGASFALAASACADPVYNGEELLYAADRVEWEAGGLYDGRFSDGTPFQIEIAYAEPAVVPKEARGLFSPSYWYPRHFTGKVLALVAGAGPAGTLTLTVPSRDGRNGEETFVITLDRGGLSGQGSWTSEKLGKTLRFTLRRSVSYHGVAVARPVPPELAQQADGRRFTYSAIYPVLADASVNAWLREMLRDCMGDLTCVDTVNVTWNAGGLLSLDAHGWSYSLGAAHGNGGSRSRHYLVGAGKAEPATLARFLDPSPACRAKASREIVARLRAQGLPQAENGALDGQREPNFAPLPDGIRFWWNQYEVGTYADGMPSVFLTRAELGECVKNLPKWE